MKNEVRVNPRAYFRRAWGRRVFGEGFGAGHFPDRRWRRTLAQKQRPLQWRCSLACERRWFVLCRSPFSFLLPFRRIWPQVLIQQNVHWHSKAKVAYQKHSHTEWIRYCAKQLSTCQAQSRRRQNWAQNLLGKESPAQDQRQIPSGQEARVDFGQCPS